MQAKGPERPDPLLRFQWSFCDTLAPVPCRVSPVDGSFRVHLVVLSLCRFSSMPRHLNTHRINPGVSRSSNRSKQSKSSHDRSDSSNSIAPRASARAVTDTNTLQLREIVAAAVASPKDGQTSM